jgi:hypothetical protein
VISKDRRRSIEKLKKALLPEQRVSRLSHNSYENMHQLRCKGPYLTRSKNQLYRTREHGSIAFLGSLCARDADGGLEKYKKLRPNRNGQDLAPHAEYLKMADVKLVSVDVRTDWTR